MVFLHLRSAQLGCVVWPLHSARLSKRPNAASDRFWLRRQRGSASDDIFARTQAARPKTTKSMREVRAQTVSRRAPRHKPASPRHQPGPTRPGVVVLGQPTSPQYGGECRPFVVQVGRTGNRSFVSPHRQRMRRGLEDPRQTQPGFLWQGFRCKWMCLFSPHRDLRGFPSSQQREPQHPRLQGFVGGATASIKRSPSDWFKPRPPPSGTQPGFPGPSGDHATPRHKIRVGELQRNSISCNGRPARPPITTAITSAGVSPIAEK